LVYRVRIERKATKALEKLKLNMRKQIVEAIRSLAKDPRLPGSKKMENREGWRIRVGDYRVIYGINDEELAVLVVKIGHRRSVYREV
jgi:mRNA interferase RelE/StbE